MNTLLQSTSIKIWQSQTKFIQEKLLTITASSAMWVYVNMSAFNAVIISEIFRISRRKCQRQLRYRWFTLFSSAWDDHDCENDTSSIQSNSIRLDCFFLDVRVYAWAKRNDRNGLMHYPTLRCSLITHISQCVSICFVWAASEESSRMLPSIEVYLITWI